METGAASEGSAGSTPAPTGAAAPPAVAEPLTRTLIPLLLVSFTVFCGFFLPLSVMPLYAVEGGASSSGAGLATGALTLSAVAAQLATPRMLARLGYRGTLVVALLLISLPTLLLTATSALWLIVAVSVVRGLGFGTAFVIGSALVAELVGPERRGQATGLYGLSVGVPNTALLPLGVWLSQQVGFVPVLAAAGLVPLVGLAAVTGIRMPGVPARTARPRSGAGVLGGLRAGALLRPFLMLLSVTMAGGLVVTFLPLAADASAGLVTVALTALGITVTLSRWLAGVAADRWGAGRLLAPGLLTAAVGVLAPIWSGSPLVLLVGMLLFGVGYGALQSVTLVVMFARVPRSGYSTVSAQWNVAFDGGLGLGSTAFGVVIERAGYDPAFAVAAALLAAGVVLVARDRRLTGTGLTPHPGA